MEEQSYEEQSPLAADARSYRGVRVQAQPDFKKKKKKKKNGGSGGRLSNV
jgi:hypothetical protein